MGQPPAAPQNGFGITGMVLGIVSIVTACCPYLGILLGGIGLVFGFLGKKKVSTGYANNNGVALAGIICSAIGLVLSIIILVALGSIDVDQLNKWVEEQQQIQQSGN
ncbi:MULTISPECIES: DUF4190 domain-containing protein [Actinoplanes]|uniref:DUF4190 domain-containing protein n=1 Tax=Actinoplanes TaxID=1865 RepID=UPI0005F2DAB0|nr:MULTISPECIES: DUF4190 domain-containing protein [Actinoplanes]GLY01039.1 hypothetical protein Acsp01_14180 [Actinoplanes sp. NBRC 101535]